jgi:hypothetical protein
MATLVAHNPKNSRLYQRQFFVSFSFIVRVLSVSSMGFCEGIIALKKAPSKCNPENGLILEQRTERPRIAYAVVVSRRRTAQRER